MTTHAPPLLSSEMRSRLFDVHMAHAGLAECMVATVYQHLLKPGDEFIDAGGRVGAHTKPMSNLVGPRGRGAVFEPNPASQAKLQTLLDGDAALDANTTLVPKALSDKIGSASFYCRQTHDGWSSLYADHAPAGDLETPTRIDVAVTTLDSACDDLGLSVPKFIKIDVEGAELDVIAGAARIMSVAYPVIAFETMPDEALAQGRYTADSFFDVFDASDYKIVDLFWEPLTRDRLRTDPKLPYYYFAMPSDHDMGEIIFDWLYLGRLMQHARRLDSDFIP